jgi:hypothetical protein
MNPRTAHSPVRADLDAQCLGIDPKWSPLRPEVIRNLQRRCPPQDHPVSRRPEKFDDLDFGHPIQDAAIDQVIGHAEPGRPVTVVLGELLTPPQVGVERPPVQSILDGCRAEEPENRKERKTHHADRGQGHGSDGLSPEYLLAGLTG